MILPPELRIRVPATSANLGPGFDLFGLALDQYARFHFEFLEESHFELLDSRERPIPIPEEKNLVRFAYLQTLEKRAAIHKLPGFRARIHMDLPTGRGFGSSASALVAGVAAANHCIASSGELPLSLDEELQLLVELEGHPDNVCAARLGGWIFTYTSSRGKYITIPERLPQSLGLAIVVPRFQVSTKKSRSILPEHYTLNDIKSNLQGIVLWMEYLKDGDSSLLREALVSDRIHEPWRGHNIPGYKEIREGVLRIGGYGTTISGSGPGILIYYPLDRREEFLPQLKETVKSVSERFGEEYPVRVCSPDYEGLAMDPMDLPVLEGDTVS